LEFLIKHLMIKLKNYRIEVTTKGVNIEHLSGPVIKEDEINDIKKKIIDVYNEHLFQSSNDKLIKEIESKILHVLNPYIRQDKLNSLLNEI